MTTLCIDIGNTNIVAAVFTDTWSPVLRVESRDEVSASLLATQLGGMLVQRGVAADAVTAVGVASVVPGLCDVVADALQRCDLPEPRFVMAATSDLSFVLPDPSIVGADRIANAVAARTNYGAPVISIDFGTATTFEYVAPNGIYLSGPIVPGIALQKRTLVAAAAQLDDFEWNDDVPVFVEDTVTALQSGLLYSTVGAVNHVLDSMLDEVEVDATIVATGGFAELVAPNLAHDVVVDPMLTLEGIRIMSDA